MVITGSSFDYAGSEFRLHSLLDINMVAKKDEIEEVTDGADKQVRANPTYVLTCHVLCCHVIHNIHVLLHEFTTQGLCPSRQISSFIFFTSLLFFPPLSFTSFSISFLRPFSFFLFQSSTSLVLSPYSHTLNTHFSLLLLHSLLLVEDRARSGRH